MGKQTTADPAPASFDDDDVLTLAEVGQLLRVSEDTVMRLCDDGLLRYLNIGRGPRLRRRVLRGDVRAFVAERVQRD